MGLFIKFKGTTLHRNYSKILKLVSGNALQKLLTIFNGNCLHFTHILRESRWDLSDSAIVFNNFEGRKCLFRGTTHEILHYRPWIEAPVWIFVHRHEEHGMLDGLGFCIKKRHFVVVNIFCLVSSFCSCFFALVYNGAGQLNDSSGRTQQNHPSSSCGAVFVGGQTGYNVQ